MSTSTQKKTKHHKWIMLVDDNFTMEHFNVIESFGYKALDAEQYVAERIDNNWTHLAYGYDGVYNVQGVCSDAKEHDDDSKSVKFKLYPNFISFLEDHLEMNND